MSTELSFPKNSKLLSVGIELESGVNIPFIYYLAGEGTEDEVTLEEEKRYFEVRQTGQVVSEIVRSERYIGSYEIPGHSHRYHAFELKEELLPRPTLTLLPQTKRSFMKPEMILMLTAVGLAVISIVISLLTLTR